MIEVAKQVLIHVGMLVGLVGTIGVGNAVLYIATKFKARWYLHVALWLGAISILITDVYLGADAGMWCLWGEAIPEHMQCGSVR